MEDVEILIKAFKSLIEKHKRSDYEITNVYFDKQSKEIKYTLKIYPKPHEIKINGTIGQKMKSILQRALEAAEKFKKLKPMTKPSIPRKRSQSVQ